MEFRRVLFRSVTVYDIIVFPPRRVFALGLQNFEIIPMKRIWTGIRVGTGQLAEIALTLSPRNHRPERARFALKLDRPIEPVRFAWRAGKLPRVFQHPRAVPVAAGIFPLRVHIRPHGSENVQLVAADSPVDNFLSTGLGVEHPATAHLYDWNRERP